MPWSNADTRWTRLLVLPWAVTPCPLLPRLCLWGNRQQRLGSAASAGSAAVEEAWTPTVRWCRRNAARVTWREQGKGVHKIPLQRPSRSGLLQQPPAKSSSVRRSLSRTTTCTSRQWQQPKQNQSDLQDDECGIKMVPVACPTLWESSLCQGRCLWPPARSNYRAALLEISEGCVRLGILGYKRGGLDVA